MERLDAGQPQQNSHCILLLVDHDDSAAAMRMRKALRKAPNPPRVLCALTPTQAIRHLDKNTVDAVLVDLCCWERLEPQAKRDLLAAARPIVVLLDEDDIVDPAKAIEVGAAGFYYKDQLDASFVRRLNQLVGASAMGFPRSAALGRGRPRQGSS